MNDKTHISILLDRTGSMAGIRDDVIGGFNAFVDGQRAEGGEATLTVVQFDSQDAYEVICQSVPLQQAPVLSHSTYVPRASTPLYDALGRGILDLEQALSRLPPPLMPGKIVFVVVTDGAENASHEFNRERVMALIKAKRELGWQFVFLSADLEAFEDSAGLGVNYSSRLYFQKSGGNTRHAFQSASEKIVSYRQSHSEDVSFDDDDRRKQEDRI